MHNSHSALYILHFTSCIYKKAPYPAWDRVPFLMQFSELRALDIAVAHRRDDHAALGVQ